MAEAYLEKETMTENDFLDVLKRIENFDVFYLTDIDLLLIGKTGTGKSSTGNSILMKDAFKADDDCDSVTDRVQNETSIFKNRIIKVVDGPGIADTHMMTDTREAAEKVLKEMRDTIKMNTHGYHAFLLVIKYPNRLTKEDRDCIETLKFIFGFDFIAKYCILVVTGGDQFDKKWSDKKKTFKEWCEEQTNQTFQHIYKECKKRAVLFNNSTDSYKKKKRQLKMLIQIVDQLPCDHKRFADTHFEKASKMLDTAKVRLKDPKLRQRMLEKISLVLQMQVWINEQTMGDQLDYFKKLRESVDKLCKYLTEEQKKSGLLKSLIKLAQMILKDITDKIKGIEEIFRMQGIQNSTQEELRAMKNVLTNMEMEYKFAKSRSKHGHDLKKKEEEIREYAKKYHEKRMALEAQDLENITKDLPTETEKRNAKQRIIEESDRKKKELAEESKARRDQTVLLYQNKKRACEDRIMQTYV